MSENYKNHSIMLGQIANEVDFWCDEPECTTLEAVQLMKAQLLESQANNIRLKIEMARLSPKRLDDIIENLLP